MALGSFIVNRLIGLQRSLSRLLVGVSNSHNEVGISYNLHVRADGTGNCSRVFVSRSKRQVILAFILEFFLHSENGI